MQIRHAEADRDLLLLIERGEEIPRVLIDTCLDHDLINALVQGSGRATSIILEGGPAGRRSIAGPLELLQITGRVEQKGGRLEPELRVVASRDMDTGLEVVGGVVISAKMESGLLRLTRHVAAVRGKAIASPAMAWSAVAAASAELGEPTFAESEEPPQVGDIVDHPRFGACTVVKIDDQHLRIRRQEGRVISLGLALLTFSSKGERSDGKRVFAVKVDPKRR
jgi:predicted DNA-binding protein with PD1-like motif